MCIDGCLLHITGFFFDYYEQNETRVTRWFMFMNLQSEICSGNFVHFFVLSCIFTTTSAHSINLKSLTYVLPMTIQLWILVDNETIFAAQEALRREILEISLRNVCYSNSWSWFHVVATFWEKNAHFIFTLKLKMSYFNKLNSWENRKEIGSTFQISNKLFPSKRKKRL